MSGAHRKVSRSLVDASSTVSPGIGSHSHFKQSENELKQKLDALDTSFKLSNKKISSETRELRQILFDLQRDLKVSKSVSQYVPSSMEEQTGQVKRQRRVTVASGCAAQDLMADTGGVTVIPTGGAQGTTTKRRRKISSGGAPPRDTEVLIQEDDVLSRQNRSAEKVVEEKDIGIEMGGDLSSVRLDISDECVKESRQQEVVQTPTCKQDQELTSETIFTLQTSEQKTNEPASSPHISDLYKDLRNAVDLESDSRVKHPASSHSGMFSSTDTQPNNSTDTLKRTSGPVFGYDLAYSKHFNEDRKRSLSDSDANYRDAFKGRFMTQALPERMKEHSRLQLPEPEKRTRRFTVSGPPPIGARRLLDVGDIPVRPFSPGTRRKASSGRGPTGGLFPLRRCSDNDEVSTDMLEGVDKDLSRGRYNSTVARPQEQRQRRSSQVGHKTSSHLPPLKEETRSATMAGIANQWKNLENCRYLRKEEQELSIKDVFKKN